METQRATSQTTWDNVAIAVKMMLEAMGHDISSPGLIGTPVRVAKAWEEMLCGYREDPDKILKTSFPAEGYDEMITLAGVPFTSICEHHLLPFSGKATIAYLPDGDKVVGISKLARLLDCFSKRLQIQERLTAQIAKALQDSLSPRGVGVHLQATHLCMVCRGVKKPQATMITTKLLGRFLESVATREEFFLQLKLNHV
jgi:GTP cyclohydrolase I